MNTTDHPLAPDASLKQARPSPFFTLLAFRGVKQHEKTSHIQIKITAATGGITCEVVRDPPARSRPGAVKFLRGSR